MFRVNLPLRVYVLMNGRVKPIKSGQRNRNAEKNLRIDFDLRKK